MSANRPFRLAVVAGEESGDLLGADLVRALRNAVGGEIELVGAGGTHLQSEGLNSLFDPAIIAIVGATAVVRDLPRLLKLIGSTSRALADAKPDCLVTIDSPAFNLRVARKVRKLDPSIPVVKYVCPSVWGWLPGRAVKMKSYTDHVLCLLPFEPAELKRLGGPPGTFVGHRLSTHQGIVGAQAAQAERSGPDKEIKHLLVLPGSRKSEVAALGGPFAEAVNMLSARGHRLRISIPTVSRVERQVRDVMLELGVTPEILTTEQAKWQAFGEADAALAASGTVSLELALAGVPLVSCYKTDVLMKFAYPFITTWSASLPNLIADKAIIPEFYDRFVRPGHLARTIEPLLEAGPARAVQLNGFADVRNALATDKPAGELAADIVLKTAGWQR